jgi:hypothetical protein
MKLNESHINFLYAVLVWSFFVALGIILFYVGQFLGWALAYFIFSLAENNSYLLYGLTGSVVVFVASLLILIWVPHKELEK